MSEFDKAYEVFKESGLVDIFAQWFDYYMNAPPQDRAYVMKGPDWMGWVRHLPKEESGQLHDAWMISYLNTSGSVTLLDLMNMLPYKLPLIAFGRSVRGRMDLKFFPADRIARKVETANRIHHAQFTQTTSGPDTTGSSSGSSSNTSGPCGRDGCGGGES